VGRINIHRVIIPETESKDGIVINTKYSLENGNALIDSMKIYTVVDGLIGRDISDTLDLFCHLWLTKLVTEELALV
tara:strand:- start:3635 stop:3862 length:228 start_codon:yes stop_codon:yes gene_type:complete